VDFQRQQVGERAVSSNRIIAETVKP